MRPTYSKSQLLAIAAGTAAAAGAIALLLTDQFGSGRFTINLAITPLVVSLTITAGHLIGSALRAQRPLAMFGFLIAFAVGTAVTVLNGAGRQAEGQELRIATAEQANAAIADKQAELVKARERLDEANRNADSERGTTCRKRCTNWEQRAKEVQALIGQLEHELAALGPARPTNVKAERAAQIAALLGGDHDRIKTLIVLLDPVAVPFLLEWSAIVAFGFGFGHRRQSPGKAPATTAQSSSGGAHRTEPTTPLVRMPKASPSVQLAGQSGPGRGRRSNQLVLDFSEPGRSPRAALRVRCTERLDDIRDQSSRTAVRIEALEVVPERASTDAPDRIRNPGQSGIIGPLRCDTEVYSGPILKSGIRCYPGSQFAVRNDQLNRCVSFYRGARTARKASQSTARPQQVEASRTGCRKTTTTVRHPGAVWPKVRSSSPDFCRCPTRRNR